MKKHISEKFRNFAIKECKGSSELYETLSISISKDDEILQLASMAREGQPIPNLLFGAVHYLLLKGKNHKLKEYYPSMVEAPSDVEDSFFYFNDFCQQYSGEIITILKEKSVQTNEVRRCAYLFPAFQFVYDIVKKPLALVEIGTSAGLQLLWDQYSYSYGTNQIYGNEESNVHISSKIVGKNRLIMKDSIPPVASRIGVDLQTMDVNNQENYLWLNALIWPNHHERRVLFEKAVHYVKNNTLTLIEGDGVGLLKQLSERISKDYTLCIFHTHVANQMPIEVKTNLLEQVKSIGSDREIFHIYNNIQDSRLHLDYYLNGEESKNVIGETDGHGRWFSWEL
ncbi:DUF2332 domain-containing protein [Salinibacillus xinjiangensis]|uniref:DUF2332 family protein n=1 Tax=Salinibacillus xinjiangensis TaxID=1229268 RepID=A0A6G1X4T0_9BACI|nr:DUF2332 domain-containing protein [Salinibacillus xinjiangensis]MRG85906.1 DUF2332 family protein [Salinibacillus xinjiangensis]